MMGDISLRQADIKINDFTLIIKGAGWVRLDTTDSCSVEADDYHLDIKSKKDIINICQLLEKQERK